jgi:hypothetical protein
MPAFGPIGSHAGSEEPHAGFKVFVANEDRRGLSWMVVLHQGSGSPRRGTVRLIARVLVVPEREALDARAARRSRPHDG